MQETKAEFMTPRVENVMSHGHTKSRSCSQSGQRLRYLKGVEFIEFQTVPTDLLLNC